MLKNTSQDRADNAADMRATLLLTYGYLLWYCPIDIVTQRYDATVARVLRPYLDGAKVTFHFLFYTNQHNYRTQLSSALSCTPSR